MRELELKPCPFCGGEAEIISMSEKFTVSCGTGGCMANISYCSDKQSAVKSWNKRASDWIPCIERMPKVMMDVLLQFEKNMCVGFYSQGYWNVNSGNGFYTAVLPSEDQPIAWMPLPEPPGGEES